MLHRFTRLFISACIVLTVAAKGAAGERTAIYPGVPGPELAPSILFETAFPLNDLHPTEWTPSQQREIHYFSELMKKDSRIFLLVQVSMDPIGSRDDGGRTALSLSHAFAERLRESGIRQDRMLIVPGITDDRIFDMPRWDGFAGAQKVIIRGLQGGPWLTGRETAVAIREELPPEGSIRILEPRAEKTDQSMQILAGTVGKDVGSVSISVGQEGKTAAVYDGRFEVPISLRQGENRIVVTGLDAYGRAQRASRTIIYTPPKPSIVITHPPKDMAADVSRTPVITVRGRIESRNPLKAAYMMQNDIPIHLRVREDGTFEQAAALVTEEDILTVEAEDMEGRTGVSDQRKVGARGIAERPLMAILHWDEDDVDLDLHIVDELDHHTWFDAPNVFQDAKAIPDGMLLIDNKKGFGPEVFMIEKSLKGAFTFYADYYRGKKTCRAYLTVVLFAGSPSRKIVHAFGPIIVSPDRRKVELVKVILPAGTIQELKH